MDLDSMKYSELQHIAKELGLKANVKADKLLKAIKEYQQKRKGEEQIDSKGESSSRDSSGEGNVPCSALFVSNRRGKGKPSKRKLSYTEFEATMPPNVEKGNDEVDESNETSDCSERRNVSSKAPKPNPPEESQTTVSEHQPPDYKDNVPLQNQAEKPPKVKNTGRIPRLQQQQKKKKNLKSITPNFKKLHEAQFEKLESIDSYVQRRTKEMETYKTSGKDQKKTNSARASLFSPVPDKKKTAEEQPRHTVLSQTNRMKKPSLKEDGLFRPSVLSTRRINVRFSEATQNNVHKKSLMKTPVRMSSCLATSTPNMKTEAGNSKKPFSATKTQGHFIFTGNMSMSTPGTKKKTTFDLKESLSRPLSYKPHKGKLKPFGEENTASNNSLASNPQQEIYKRHQIQSRGERRMEQVKGRKQKKDDLLGARRGLVMM